MQGKASLDVMLLVCVWVEGLSLPTNPPGNLTDKFRSQHYYVFLDNQNGQKCHISLSISENGVFLQPS